MQLANGFKSENPLARIPVSHPGHAPLAQLDRASVYETEGCWFEPSGVHFLSHAEIITYNQKAFVTPTKAFCVPPPPFM